jgi:hypothetical protein
MLIAPVGLDRVWFNPTAGGTADFVFSSALTPGFQSPAAAGAVNGARYSYFAQSTDLTQWEVGVGTWVTSSGTLLRTFIQFSTNANAKVNFTLTPTVAIDCRAEDVRNVSDLLHAMAGGI